MEIITFTYLWSNPDLTGLLRGLNELRQALSTLPYTKKVTVHIASSYNELPSLIGSDAEKTFPLKMMQITLFKNQKTCASGTSAGYLQNAFFSRRAGVLWRCLNVVEQGLLVR